MRLFRSASALLLAVLLGASRLFAHDPGLSSLTLKQHAAGAALELQLAPQDAARLLVLDPDGSGVVSDEELRQITPALQQLLVSWVALRDGSGTALLLRPAAPEVDHAGNNVILRGEIGGATRGSWRLELVRLGDLPPGHREFVSVATASGQLVAEALLSRTTPKLTFSWPAPGTGSEPVASPEPPQSTATGSALRTGADGDMVVDEDEAPARESTFLAFLKLGVEHILTGYDHLLYLGGLLIVCRSVRSILAIVTSFTVAHSLTLGLATFGKVDLPPSLVEPLIAASIVFVAVENLWLRDREPRWRWVAAFGFGLIHGFGFAGLLRELGVADSPGGVLVPLFSFNLGVELGQLAVVAVALPLLLGARRRWPAFATHGIPALSLVVAAAGAWWFIERVWL